MEQHSLEHINPSQLKNFVRKLCEVSHRYAKKHQAIENLDRHIKKLKKHSKGKKSLQKDYIELKPKINQVLEAERKILNPRIESDTEGKLRANIHQLEIDLERTKQERDKASQENSEKINELSATLLSIKTRMDELLQAKKIREERIKELEKKIRKKID